MTDPFRTWTLFHARPVGLPAFRVEGDALRFRATSEDLAVEGRLELLRTADGEGGPFTVVRAWDPHDPVVESEGWKAQVLGWAVQVSLEESPTAGWGASQGAIERVGSLIIWSLASTSIGRGYHTVRTGAGTYVLEVILSR